MLTRYIKLAIIASGILYCYLLWQPFGYWLLSDVIAPLFTTVNVTPNILSGLLLILLSWLILIILFILPFTIVWSLVIGLLIWKESKRP